MRNILTKIFAVIAMSVTTVAAWASPIAIPQDLGSYIVIGSATGADGFASYISKTNCQVDSRLGDAEHSKYYAIGSTRSDSKVNINVTTSEAGNYVFGFKSGASGCSSVVTIKLTAVGSETPLFTSGAIAIANDGNWDPNIEHNFYITGLEADANYTLSLEVKEITSGSYAGNFGNFFFHHVDQLTWATSSAYMELSDGTFTNARDNNDNVINYISRAGGYIDDLLIYNDEAGYRIFHFNIDSHKQASKVTITVTDFATGIQEAQATKVVTANGDYLQPLTTEISAGLKVIRFDFADNDNTADDSYLFNFRWVYFTSPTDYDALPITGTATLNLNQVGAIFSGCRYENDETTKNIGYVKDGSYVDNYYVYNTNAYAYYMLDAGISWYKKGGTFAITVTDVATGNVEINVKASPTITGTGDVHFNLPNAITDGLKKIRFDFVNKGESDYLFNLNNVSFSVKQADECWDNEGNYLCSDITNYDTPKPTSAGGTSDWGTAANWGKGSVPTAETDVVITQPMRVNVTDARAKSVVLDQYGDNTGSLTISAGKELLIEGTLRKKDAEGATVATAAEDLIINSNGTNGLGALVMGNHDGTNQATVNFYSISHGTKGSSESVSQYVGTPFNDESDILHSWYNSWVYGIIYNGSGVIGWNRIESGEGMEAFKGYAVISADGVGHIYEMSGTLNASADQTLGSLNYQSGTASNPNNENLLANSWMAPIKISAMESTDFVNTEATVYIFNAGSPDDYDPESTIGSSAGQYSSYTIGTAGDAVIPAMQSFSVYTTGSSASVTLDYERLVYNPALAGTAAPVANKARRRSHVAADEANKIRLYVTAESGYGDMLYMWGHEDFDEGFENGWDGHKVYGESVAPQLYAVTPDGNMAVNCVPAFEGTVVGFRAGANETDYTFTFEYDSDEPLYLLDTQTGVYTPVATGNSYPFYEGDNEAHNRFILTRHNAPQTPTDNGEWQTDNEAKARKFIDGNRMFILLRGVLYDATGKRVKQQ